MKKQLLLFFALVSVFFTPTTYAGRCSRIHNPVFLLTGLGISAYAVQRFIAIWLPQEEIEKIMITQKDTEDERITEKTVIILKDNEGIASKLLRTIWPAILLDFGWYLVSESCN